MIRTAYLGHDIGWTKYPVEPSIGTEIIAVLLIAIAVFFVWCIK